ncbi:MAG: hypothetical protein H5T41_06575 [Methanomassiliicoccales archaeon]|nr:hypothetical protein [Methanomassiliicoccales archaeon]
MCKSRKGADCLKLRRSRFLKRDREAVASTVGTIMALLVFLTFLSLFTNSYIPVWMQANERSHMNIVLNQFGDLKGRIDNMIVSAKITGETEFMMYSPITLGAEGIPIFASPTAGQLIYAPIGSSNTGFSMRFNYTLSGERVEFNESGGGLIQLWAPNRYYVQQWVAYENGAIIVKQPDGQVVRAFPGILLQKIDNRVNIVITQIDMMGSNVTIGGTGAIGVNINLIYFESQSFTVGYGNDYGVNITMVTQYGKAWEQYLKELCSKSGLTDDVDYSLNKVNIGEDLYYIKFQVKNARSLTYDRAYLQISIQV